MIAVPTPDAQGSKVVASFVATLSLALCYFFSTLAMMNVSLVWIEIAENADKMQKSTNHNISRYRNLLIVYYVVFFGVILVSLLLGNELLAAAIAMPGVLFVIVTYFVGFFKMKRMMVMYLSSDTLQDGSIGAMASHDTLRAVRESLRMIERAALGVSLSALGFVVFIGIWVFLGGFIEEPNRGFEILALGFAWVFVSLGNSVVMWYLHSAIKRKRKVI